MKKIIVKAGVLSCLFCLCAFGDEEHAKMLKLAEQGDVKAQYRLSVWYLLQGTGVDKDIQKSVEWYKKALKQDAMMDTQETRDILQSLKDAAEQGDAEAQYTLGMCFQHAAGYYAEEGHTAYLTGGGIAFGADTRKVLAWFEKSAEQGYVDAQIAIAMCYAQGTGVSQDDVEAAKWMRKAADQEHAVAQRLLASYYYGGIGVPRNISKSVGLLRKAEAQGHKKATEILKAIEEEYGSLPTEEPIYEQIQIEDLCIRLFNNLSLPSFTLFE